jgi:hypothetical protein
VAAPLFAFCLCQPLPEFALELSRGWRGRWKTTQTFAETLVLLEAALTIHADGQMCKQPLSFLVRQFAVEVGGE